MTVTLSESAISAHHQNENYYFCCQRCADRFTADPYFYLSGSHKRRAETPVADAVYICPMCPEIEQAEPGPCPICGMALEPMSGVSDEPNPELLDFQRRLQVAVVCALPLLLISMGPMAGLAFDQWLDGWLVAGSSLWLQWLLATPVVFWAAAPFFVRGWQSLKSRHYNMWTLIMLGVGVAYGYSTLALLFPQWIPEAMRSGGEVPVYFESAVVIVVLIFVGQVLELRAREKTNDAVQALLQLAPKTAWRINADGSEYAAPVENLLVGDTLRIRPGEQIAVDGTVLEGRTTVDESLISGEPIPVEKTAGAEVTAGTLNRTGSVVMQAVRVGPDTVLAHIINMVNTAQRSRAPVQQLADRVAGVFVPTVVAVAIVAFVAWLLFGPPPALVYALLAAISVLVIACPCALGLATPMSIMTAVGRGAREGILVRDASVFETLAQADTLIVDKTGTLTLGQPQLTDIISWPAQESTPERAAHLLSRVAALEVASEHPLASAIVDAARERGLQWEEVREFDALTGQGIVGQVESHRVAVGNRSLMDRQGVDLSPVETTASELETAGKTVIFVGIDGALAGYLAVADPVRENAAAAIAQLQGSGFTVVMATGDNAHTAGAIASQLGITEVHSALMPADKKSLVDRMNAHGHQVVMIGDGINDAPALASAATGIAMGAGADVAIESAGITLLRNDLDSVVSAVKLAKATVRNLWQNLFFAFVYNAAGIPIAAGLLYPVTGWLLSPMLAAAAMSLSSVSVIANALRLRHEKI